MTMITIHAPTDDVLCAFARRAADVFRAWRRGRTARRSHFCAWTGDWSGSRPMARRADDIRSAMSGVGSHSLGTQRDLWAGGPAWMR